MEQGGDDAYLLMSRSSARDHLDPKAAAEQYAFLPLYMKPKGPETPRGGAHHSQGMRALMRGATATGGAPSGAPSPAGDEEIGSIELAFARASEGIASLTRQRQQIDPLDPEAAAAAAAANAWGPKTAAAAAAAASYNLGDERDGEEIFDILD